MGQKGFTGAAFYDYLDEHKLMGTRCQSCGMLHLPPRSLCTACYGEELEWEGAPNVPKPEMRERREFRFTSFPDGARGIDVALTYKPGATVPLHIKPMSWGGQSDLIFALMVIRVAPELGNTRVVTVATGATVEPRTREAADNPDDWKARWMDISGTINGKKYGIAFIAHPQNPGG